jgi:DNA ligase 1
MPRSTASLLVGTPPDHTGSFSDLQQRLNRKTVSDKHLKLYPAFVRCYDLLQEGGEDLRALPFFERRARLEAFIERLGSPRFDLRRWCPFRTGRNWKPFAPRRRIPSSRA